MLAPVLAARVHAFGADPLLDDVPEPEPQPGESLVEVLAAPIGHIDLTVLRGTFVHRPLLPYVPGTEAAGTIRASSGHLPGAPVRLRGGGLGLSRDGTWRELVNAPDDAIHALPPDVDPTLAAVSASPASTAYTAVHEVGGVAAGERVAVTGAAGAVGSLAVQLALRAGAGAVFGLTSRPEKRAAVPAGAEAILSQDGLPAEVDVLIDTVGGPRLSELVLGLRRGGRAVLVGYTAGTDVTFDLPKLLAADVRILPVSMLSRRLPAPLLDELLQLLARGELALPFSVRPLRRLPEALREVRGGLIVGRVALDPAR
jgi:NADPH2:quinone reductase